MARIMLLFVLILSSAFFARGVVFAPILPQGNGSDGSQEATSTDAVGMSTRSPTLLFGGDVMLARQVERFIRSEGYDYPFVGLTDVFASYDSVLVNFEATVPRTHVPTPSMGFSFSVAEDIASSLSNFGVTHIGLANNHAYDFGSKGYENARMVLTRAGMTPFGHPEHVTPSEVVVITVGDLDVAIIPVHSVFKEYYEEDLRAAFLSASTTDYQIVYVHWGTEYEPVHDPAQERMAKRMIALGADAVVGHHPHVVQDIARYGDALVFYSLGNLIFDQYWNQEVRTGLLLGLRETDGGLTFTLIPTQSRTKSVSETISGDERAVFLEGLAARSHVDLRASIENGELESVTSRLASDAQ